MTNRSLTINTILKVAIAVPLRKTFDYGFEGNEPPQPGCQVKVTFAGKRAIGVVLEHSNQTDVDPARLKSIAGVIDTDPILSSDDIALLRWASDYYHHPIGEVIQSAMPSRVRRARDQSRQQLSYFTLAVEQADALHMLASNARRQIALVELLGKRGIVDSVTLAREFPGYSSVLSRLLERNLVRITHPLMDSVPDCPPELNSQQRNAVATVLKKVREFQCYLLKGITGSGKTEVYLHCAAAVLQQGRQVLFLVPEIALTPQLIERVEGRLRRKVAALHSGLNDGERQSAWLSARKGESRVVLGTRSAVFASLPEIGLIIVDEEHDASFKQQDGFRYHARDVAIKRASLCNIPIILGSATPALESWQNAKLGRFALLPLSNRAGNASLPDIHLVNTEQWPQDNGLTRPLLSAIAQRLERGEQSLVFINRRGFAPVVICNDCGWRARCNRCDSYLTRHAQSPRLRCHHCGWQSAPLVQCPDCGSERFYLGGEGTQRIESQLLKHFPQARILRIDRDSSAAKGQLEAHLGQVRQGEVDIIVGTQLLSKGHDFAAITLVGVLNADQAMFSVDLRASERLFQGITQVAGRAGRGERPGEVLIQTRYPDHPCLKAIQQHDYDQFARVELLQRKSSGFPPFTFEVLFRAETVQQGPALAFLSMVRQQALALAANRSVDIMDPVPAPMERRAGRFRAQLLMQCVRRGPLNGLLRQLIPIIEGNRESRKVRWSVDIDPVDGS